jgi:glycosyltransferase involved in cell wall biosynthesis
MLNGRRVAVVLPAYNAANTLERTIAELDRAIVDDVILVDDNSSDQTVELAQSLGLTPTTHSRNLGYGANQKTCYRLALDRGADIIVMVHPDYQYSPRLVPALAAMIAYGEYDLALGSRILAQNAVHGGMPLYKYVANRTLTAFENVVMGAKLSEYHTGLRAYARSLLEAVRFDLNSDDFVFDNQLLAQAMAASARIGELSCPTRYDANSSSINFRRSVMYGIGCVRTSVEFWMSAHGVRSYAYLTGAGPLHRADEGPGGDTAGAGAEEPPGHRSGRTRP